VPAFAHPHLRPLLILLLWSTPLSLRMCPVHFPPNFYCILPLLVSGRFQLVLFLLLLISLVVFTPPHNYPVFPLLPILCILPIAWFSLPPPPHSVPPHPPSLQMVSSRLAANFLFLPSFRFFSSFFPFAHPISTVSFFFFFFFFFFRARFLPFYLPLFTIR